jgi:predicted nucleic acid-binding protein
MYDWHILFYKQRIAKWMYRICLYLDCFVTNNLAYCEFIYVIEKRSELKLSYYRKEMKEKA